MRAERFGLVGGTAQGARPGRGDVALPHQSLELLSSFLVSFGRFFGRVEGPEPDSHTTKRVPNLCRPFAPSPLPNPPVLGSSRCSSGDHPLGSFPSAVAMKRAISFVVKPRRWDTDFMDHSLQTGELVALPLDTLFFIFAGGIGGIRVMTQNANLPNGFEVMARE